MRTQCVHKCARVAIIPPESWMLLIPARVVIILFRHDIMDYSLLLGIHDTQVRGSSSLLHQQLSLFYDILYINHM